MDFEAAAAVIWGKKNNSKIKYELQGREDKEILKVIKSKWEKEKEKKERKEKKKVD